MAPLHVKRNFWWELLFISVLLFLLAGIPSQQRREAVAAAVAKTNLVPAVVVLGPAAELGVVATALPLPLALK